jgi:hypothetical protein
MPSAAAWYESAFALGVGSIMVGVLAIIATVWAAVYAARPSRALRYRLKSCRPATEAELSAVPIYFPPPHPVIVEFQLRGSGHRDVPGSAFHDGTPITVSLAGRITALMTPPATFPEARTVPPAEVTDSGTLEIGPGLIGRDQVITYRLLADLSQDGRQPKLGVRGSLIDVPLRPREPLFSSTPWMVVSLVLAPATYLTLRLVLLHVHPPRVVADLAAVAAVGIVFWMASAVYTVILCAIDGVRNYLR